MLTVYLLLWQGTQQKHLRRGKTSTSSLLQRTPDSHVGRLRIRSRYVHDAGSMWWFTSWLTRNLRPEAGTRDGCDLQRVSPFGLHHKDYTDSQTVPPAREPVFKHMSLGGVRGGCSILLPTKSDQQMIKIPSYKRKEHKTLGQSDVIRS